MTEKEASAIERKAKRGREPEPLTMEGLLAAMNDKLLDALAKNNEKLLDQMDAKLAPLAATLQRLQSGLVRTLPTIFSHDVGGLVRSGDVLRGTPATYTWIRHGDAYYVLGSAHCAYYYGKSQNPDLADVMFVQLPMQIIEAGVKKIYRHKGLTHGNILKHDFVIIRVRNPPPASVPTPIPTVWPLPLEEWEQKGLLRAGVFGQSSSGPVGGTDLLVSEVDEVGVFLEINAEPGHSGTLLYSAVNQQPIGVYFGGKPAPSKGHRPRGVCVPVPPPNSTELIRARIATLTETVEYATVERGGRLVGLKLTPDKDKECCHLDDSGESWPGLLVWDSHSFTGSTVVNGACQAK